MNRNNIIPRPVPLLLLAVVAAVARADDILIHRSPLAVGLSFRSHRVPSPIACALFQLPCIDFALCDETTVSAVRDPETAQLWALNGGDERRCPGEHQVCCRPSQPIVDELLVRFEHPALAGTEPTKSPKADLFADQPSKQDKKNRMGQKEFSPGHFQKHPKIRPTTATTPSGENELDAVLDHTTEALDPVDEDGHIYGKMIYSPDQQPQRRKMEGSFDAFQRRVAAVDARLQLEAEYDNWEPNDEYLQQ